MKMMLIQLALRLCLTPQKRQVGAGLVAVLRLSEPGLKKLADCALEREADAVSCPAVGGRACACVMIISGYCRCNGVFLFAENVF